MSLIGILAFVIALLFSVMVHEAGHFLTARKFGMKVTEFFLGFGKRLWSIRRGETEFGLKAIPAGGYCRIEGMTPEDQMPEGEENRAFFRASSLRKLIVLGAGSFAHFCLGTILIFVIFFGVGVSSILPIVSSIEPQTPAESAGFHVGDRIVKIGSVTINDWANQSSLIRDSKGRELTFTVDRNGKEVILKAAPEYLAKEKRYRLGFFATIGNQRYGAIAAVSHTASAVRALTVESTKSLIALPTKVPALVRETFQGEKRDPNGLVGVVGAARVSGQTLQSQALTGHERTATFLLLIASLNIFIGLFNLLPLLPLDGGHMAVAIADEIRALYARLRGRARPAGINVNVLTPITMTVFAILAVLTVVLLIADIVNPVSLNL